MLATPILVQTAAERLCGWQCRCGDVVEFIDQQGSLTEGTEVESNARMHASIA